MQGSKQDLAVLFQSLRLTVYAQVDNLEQYLKKAESLGGKTVIPPQEVPGMGRFAWFADPEGTSLGIWQPVPQ